MSKPSEHDHQTPEYTLDDTVSHHEAIEQKEDSVEDLLWVYIGHNASRFISLIEGIEETQFKKRLSSFNTVAFFLPLVWFFYRKLYLAGIVISLFVPILLGYIFPDLPSVFFLSISIMIGTNADRYYVQSAQKKIQKLMSLGLSKEELKRRVQKMGGTSTVGAVFGGLIMFSLIAVSLLDTTTELPNCSHFSSHKLAKQVIINNQKSPISPGDIQIIKSEEIQKVEKQSYLCRYQIGLHGDQAWFRAKIYWANKEKGQFTLELAPDKTIP